MSILSLIDYMALVVVLLCALDALRIAAPHEHPFRVLGLLLVSIGAFGLLVCGERWSLGPVVYHVGVAFVAAGYFIVRHENKVRR